MKIRNIVPGRSLANDPLRASTVCKAVYLFRSGERKNQPRNQGIVLLLVVVLLAICCLILAQLSMVSFGMVSQSKQRQRDLQRYWSAISIRRAIMPQAKSIWTKNASMVKSNAELVFDLGGESHKLRIENENTKLHINRLLKEFPPQSSQDILKKYLIELDYGAFRKLALLNSDLESWTELSDVRGASLLETTNRITIWGDGRLSLWESDFGQLEDVWKGIFGKSLPEQIVTARESFPRPNWDEIKLQLDLSDDDLRKVDEWLATDSTCFSLELVSGTENARQTARLFITVHDATFSFEF